MSVITRRVAIASAVGLSIASTAAASPCGDGDDISPTYYLGGAPCHQYQPGDEESPFDRGEDTHGYGGESWEWGQDQFDEHHGPCIESVPDEQLLAAVEAKDHAQVRRVVNSLPGASLHFNVELGAVEVYSTCGSRSGEPVLKKRIAIDASLASYWNEALAAVVDGITSYQNIPATDAVSVGAPLPPQMHVLLWLEHRESNHVVM